MDPPFGEREFLDAFVRYNEEVWPAQLVLALVAVAMTAASVRGGGRAGRAVGLALGALWAWTGVVYHWLHFASVTPAAYLFGAAYLAQALLIWRASLTGRFDPRARADRFGFAGAALIAYALLVYPVVGVIAGHSYPASPTFGLPCPTTIFTLGLFLWAEPPLQRRLLVVPVAWAALGTSAAISLGMVEDYGLVVAGVVGGLGVAWKARGRPGAESEEHRTTSKGGDPRQPRRSTVGTLRV